MQTVQLKQRAQEAGSKFTAFCKRHEGEINLAGNIGAYALGATILAKSTTFVGILAGTTLVVVGTVGLCAQGVEYVLRSTKEPGAGDVKSVLAA
jgi:hypothetical protein